ncbi:MAG: bacterioferritin-associated ferredoxin [Frankiaceae bacterium]|nr:bacterioferritin-associated ferredoxin [Frankiaceae bacterium]
MYICHCRAVTERTVRAAVAAGAGSVEEIGRRCTAGTHCGACHPELERLLSERRRPPGDAVVDLRSWRHA